MILLSTLFPLLSAVLRAAEPAPAYTPGLDPASMDRTVDPCQDFYRYSCGGWAAKNPIPADQSSWSVFSKVAVDNMPVVRGILEDAAKAEKPDAVEKLIGAHYAACMDEAAVEKAGIAPLKADLDAIAAAKTVRELTALVGGLQTASVTDDEYSPTSQILFVPGARQDVSDPSKVIGSIDQGGLGLPDRDYYFKEDAKSRADRDAYRAHVAKVLELLGDSPAAAKAEAETILRLETALAGSWMTNVERRDPYKMKHALTPAQLEAMAPNVDWHGYSKSLGVPDGDTVNVTAPEFFKKLSALLGSEPLAAWKTYLRFHLANGRAVSLTRAFVQEDFDFYAKHLRGAKEMRPRWKRCVALANEQLPMAVGQVFVRKTFAPETKAAALAMTQEIKSAMARRIQASPWMAPATKAAALEKLHAIRDKIGYPDRWRDYSGLVVDPRDFGGNYRRAEAFETRRLLAKVGKPVDRDEWILAPQIVNANYDERMNDAEFPAAVLQPPLFDPKMDAAPNYGGSGQTIGHEITHAFDDNGRQYDALGNLRDWWTKDDAAQFAARAKCVSDQYSAYVAVDDIRVNGALTNGEDIADLGGISLAWDAWKAATKGQALKPVDGLTPEQRFFVGYAQGSCENIRPESAREYALTDPHSPAPYRVNGVVVNLPEFAKAFACKPGSAMVKPAGKVCSVW